ncbi:hypothetical protein KKF47_02890, partial [Patescibacteria group bacterium]|nr:hypothetical protein [Patescibacteria group bacterium]
MPNSSSNPVGSLISLLLFLVFGGWFAVKAGLISGGLLSFGGLLLLAIILLISGLRVVNQYERGVILTLGKYTSTRQPGLTWIFPGIQNMSKVDMRIITTNIPQQEVITKDNVPVGTNAVVYFRVDSAEKAILDIENFSKAVREYAQAALRDVIGGIELDTLLAEREKIADE